MHCNSIAAFACVVAIAVTGCASIETIPAQRIVQKTVAEKTYVVGEIRDAPVGGEMVRVKHYTASEIVLNQAEVVSDFSIDGPLWSHHFRKGEILRLVGTVEHEGETYTVAKADAEFGILFDDDGMVFSRIVSNVGERSAGPPMFVLYSYDASPAGPHLRRMVKPGGADGFQGDDFSLTFSGIDTDAIHLGCREYAGGTSPSSREDLTYPIGSREIRFRNLVMDVIEAAPDHLRYRVVAD